jgi:hypothetical protein
VFNRQRTLVLSELPRTQIRLSAHSSTGSTVPAWNDAGWSVITPGSNGIADVGAGVRETNNNGSNYDGSYIELRSLKLF